MQELTERAHAALLVAPRNFGIGRLVAIVLDMLDGREMTAEGAKRAFENLVGQVLKEAEEQNIIDFPRYVELNALLMAQAEEVEDIRLALLEARERRPPSPDGCLPCKKRT